MDHIGSVIVRKPFQILNMNEKCNDRYTFQINRIPTWIPDLIFKDDRQFDHGYLDNPPILPWQV
jgi:hypothetical protein